VGDPALACFQLDEGGVFRLISTAPPVTAAEEAATANGDGDANGEVDASPPPPGISFKAGVGPAGLDKTAAAFLLALLQERCPEVEGLFDVEWSARFRVHRRLADRYRVGAGFLCGDAAHIHSPVGGQGLNTGVQDAINLAWKLALVERFGADPNAVLESYGEERRPCGASTLSATDSITKTVFFGGYLLRAARFVLFPLVPLVVSREFVARRLVRWMSQMTVNVRGSSLVWGEVSKRVETQTPEPNRRHLNLKHKIPNTGRLPRRRARAGGPHAGRASGAHGLGRVDGPAGGDLPGPPPYAAALRRGRGAARA
jgi:hypothetical protein